MQKFCLWICLLIVTQYVVADTPGGIAACQLTTTHMSFPCSIGATGIHVNKIEGDKATPAGDFPIRSIFYRADKLAPNEIAILEKLKTQGFTVVALTPNDAWVDDVHSLYYNTHVQLSRLKQPLPSHENLWRPDDVYDIIVVLGYNDHPIVKGKGSAIFMHIARQNYSPTVGCVALSKPDLLTVLQNIAPGAVVSVAAGKLEVDIKRMTYPKI